MYVQPIVNRKTSYKFILTPEEKAQRKAMIDMLTDQVLARMEEFAPVGAVSRAEARKVIAKEYDRQTRAKVMATL